MVNNSHGFNWSKCSVKCNNSFGKSNAVELKKGSQCLSVRYTQCMWVCSDGNISLIFPLGDYEFDYSPWF